MAKRKPKESGAKKAPKPKKRAEKAKKDFSEFDEELARQQLLVVLDEEAAAQELFTVVEPPPVSSGFLPPELDAFELSTLQLETLRKVDFTGGTDGTPRDTRAVTPAEARIFFADLDIAEQRELVLVMPELVAGMEGAPHELRFEANRLLLEEAADTLATEIERQEKRLERLRKRKSTSPQVLEMLGEKLERKGVRQDLFARWLEDEERRFLLLDPRGDGNVVEVLGDLGTAEHVVVFVPGVGNELANFERPRFSLQSRIANIFDGLRVKDPEAEVAVIGWLGFNPPDNLLTGTRSSPARRGAAALVRFLEGLLVTAGRDLQLTVVAHSYGSVVAGRSVALGLGRWADDLLVVGSPGIGAQTADDVVKAGLPAERLYVMMAVDDPIRKTPFGVHGTIPGQASFGARRLDPGTASGHSEYFEPGKLSLEQICCLALARQGELTFLADD